MRNYLFILILTAVSNLAFGQTFTELGDHDPAAKRILDQLKESYLSLNGVSIDFELEMEFPGESSEIQEGSVAQKGDMFRLDMGAQELYCNGSAIWVYLKEVNEVQINDFEEEDQSEFLSPNEIFNMYESGEFAYAISNRFEEDGSDITQIEFKPLDKEADYSKLRLTLHKNDTEVKRFRIFSKDGSRFTMHINSMKNDLKLTDDYFKFNKANFPGVSIEDLRL